MSRCKQYLFSHSCLLIFIFVCLFQRNLSAQLTDSVKVYKRIKEVADKSKFAKFVYYAVFVDPSPAEYPVEPSSSEEKIVNPYLQHENKIIRSIKIFVFDPFGRTVNDTTKKKINFLQKAGNGTHISSHKRIIENRLLFDRNDTLNPLSISESERLIRQFPGINDARIEVNSTESKDSVDVSVFVHDKWNVTIPIVLTDMYAYGRFRNQNLFGLGQQFEQYIRFTRPDKMDYSGFYNIANINDTYISSKLYYETNNEGTGVGLVFDRPFFSSLTEWAGGAGAYKSWKYFPHTDTVTGIIRNLSLNSSVYDLWLGKNIKINSKRKLFNQSTNIIIGERVILNYFDARPSFAIDVAKSNQNSATFIGNIGFAVQQFYKEKYIYRFGATEDVPHGFISQFVFGLIDYEFNATKYYLGGEIARAMRFRAGYFSAAASYGMFMAEKLSNDITAGLKVNYFSDLFRLGKWYLREFVNYNLVYGINKAPYDKLSITSDEMYGFNGGSLSGNSKMILNLETVSYAPYNVVGFRFAPAVLIGLGTLGDEKNLMGENKIYQSYAVALMARNENLLNSTFQISFGMYPIQPDGQNEVFKYNPITSFTIRVRAFSIGKPEFISY